MSFRVPREVTIPLLLTSVLTGNCNCNVIALWTPRKGSQTVNNGSVSNVVAKTGRIPVLFQYISLPCRSLPYAHAPLTIAVSHSWVFRDRSSRISFLLQAPVPPVYWVVYCRMKACSAAISILYNFRWLNRVSYGRLHLPTIYFTSDFSVFDSKSKL